MKLFRSRSNDAGYTLLEVLVTTIILSIGLAVIFPSLFKTANHLHHLQARKDAHVVLEKVLYEAEQHLNEYSQLEAWPNEGIRPIRGVEYSYSINISTLNKNSGLYELNADVAWQGPHHGKIKKSIYLLR